MAEYAYNPSTGQGEAVAPGANNSFGDGEASHEGPSHQAKADFWASNARKNTAAHLAERELGSRSDIGGRGQNPATAEMEQNLLQVQRDLNAAQGAGDFLKVEQLQMQAQSLAEALVTGTPEQNKAEAYQEQQYDQQRAEEIDDDARDGMAQDPAVQATLQWASTTLSD